MQQFFSPPSISSNQTERVGEDLVTCRQFGGVGATCLGWTLLVLISFSRCRSLLLFLCCGVACLKVGDLHIQSYHSMNTAKCGITNKRRGTFSSAQTNREQCGLCTLSQTHHFLSLAHVQYRSTETFS